jgi:hypothetical protein
MNLPKKPGRFMKANRYTPVRTKKTAALLAAKRQSIACNNGFSI